MRTKFAVLVALGTLLVASPAAWALTAQEKLLARNAAEVDAYAKLAKEVKGLWIDGIDVVRNFVSEESVRNVRFEAFVRGARVVRAADHPDGMAEVEMQITLEEFVRNVEEIQKTVYKGKKKYEFIKVREITQQRTISVTGFGAPPSATETAAPAAAAPRPGADGFAQKAFAALGNRYTAQQKLMAKNAAEVDALAKLAKEVKGLWIDGIDVVKNFVTEESVRNVKFDAYISGAQFIDFDVSPDGIFSATAQITLMQVVRNIEIIRKSKRKGDEDIVKKVTTIVTEQQIPQVITVVGYGAIAGAGGEGAGEQAPPPAGSVR
jgi:hypothetical protein